MAGHKKHGEYIIELTTNQSNYKQIVVPQVAVAGSRDNQTYLRMLQLPSSARQAF
jgi:hypothetical protein